MLQQGCSDRAIKIFRVYEWHKRFHIGRESVDNDPSSGRPSTPINEATLSVCDGLWEVTEGNPRTK
jgi:hypothetical protein